MARSKRQTDRLLKGRLSIPHARYFLTVVTKDRRTGLANDTIAEAIIATWRKQRLNGDDELITGTIMPDHIHCLIRLGDRLTLPECIAKFKSLCRYALLKSDLEWQRNFFDHRLRADDMSESFAKYIFLNPYRSGLLHFDQRWPFFILSKDYRPEFIQHLNANQGPPSEWLKTAESIQDLIDQDRIEPSEKKT